MNVLILTPDTDIDRRIVLQANALVEFGHKVTIVGVPYQGDNFLSGYISDNIRVKRIDSKDINYDNLLVKLYKKFHADINSLAVKRNKALNTYYNKSAIYIDETSSLKPIKHMNNKVVSLNIKIMNFVSTKTIVFMQQLVNFIYRIALFFVRLLKINFFPNFDMAFFNAGIKEDADIIIANDLPSLKAASIIAQEKGIPLIYDAHENYTEQCTLMKKYAKQLEKVEAEILPNVNFWIVPNELLGNCMIEKYGNKYKKNIDKPLVIQNAIDRWNEYETCKDNDILRKKLGIGENKKILLFQGGFLAKRNLENLVKSMKYVMNTDVVLVMLGFGSFGEVLKNIARRSKLDKKVIFMDAVPQQELLRYTCSADAGIIPYPAVDKNTYYCSPNKLYEYIQARLPILANDLPFIKKVLEDNEIGKVEDFSNPRNIARAIDSIFSDEIDLKKYRYNLNKLSDLVCWEAEKQKLIDEYCKYIKDFNQFEKVSTM
ncbi:glycosyltransferase family 4 protein [Lutispora saccharofermentans]|uniref:Glycosyltransferase family 4 protein n=1 Tax=Lutispora saccharofermentans TaxID=3024236 RepID=A0ABT1NFP3_9FIRM|nr:glycosyltransferase family 4 protein [Lutispora saccharofermentans]MCQ1529161.1 glycosyltransferase family 4 protein [Lutispora saccharofermentans]